MAERDALATLSSWQAPPRRTKDSDTNDPQTEVKEIELPARTSYLPEPYKSHWEDLKKKDLAKEEEKAAEKEYQKELERMGAEHEKNMTHLRIDFRIQIDGLTEENKDLQSTIDTYDRLLEELRGHHAAEIKTLTETKELLQSQMDTKAKETATMIEMQNSQVQRLVDERAELPDKLAKAAIEALGLPSNTIKRSEVPTTAKSAALVYDIFHPSQD
jgi:hypothetical protein